MCRMLLVRYSFLITVLLTPIHVDRQSKLKKDSLLPLINVNNNNSVCKVHLITKTTYKIPKNTYKITKDTYRITIYTYRKSQNMDFSRTVFPYSDYDDTLLTPLLQLFTLCFNH